jgi:murein DD-endopeptidase MepM/ murein hydrolase activator NlpD
MNKKPLIFILIIISILAVITRKMKNTASSLLSSMKIRVDASGDGHFGSSRDGGSRRHNGVDLLVNKGQQIFAPFDGIITKQAYPYSDDRKFTGIHLTSPTGVKMKVFYMLPTAGIIGKSVKKGDVVGTAQAISEKYGPPMQDHVHVEIYSQYGTLENPQEFFNL